MPDDARAPRVGIDEARKLHRPADAPVRPQHTGDLRVAGQHVEEVSRDPRSVDAAELPVPEAGSRLDVDGDAPAAVAEHVDPVAVDDGIAADVGDLRDRVETRQGRQIVGPQRPPVCHSEGEDLARGIGDDHHVRVGRRAGAAEKAGDFGHAGMRPQLLALFGVEDLELVVDGEHEDPVAVDRGRRVRGGRDSPPPERRAFVGIERHEFGEPGGNEESAVGIGEATVHAGGILLRRLHAHPP